MNLQNITSKELLDPQFLVALRQETRAMREDKLYGDLIEIFIRIKNFIETGGELERQNQQAFVVLRELMQELEVATFFLQPRDKQLEIISTRFRNFKKYGVNIAEQFDRAIFHEFETLRTDLREDYIAALMRNTETLGKGHVMISGKRKLSTIGNWLQRYTEIYGAERRSNVEQTEFVLRTDEVANFLGETEQRELLDLLALLDALRPSRDELLARQRQRQEDDVIQKVEGEEQKMVDQRKARIAQEAQRLAQEIRKTGTLPPAVNAAQPIRPIPTRISPRRVVSAPTQTPPVAAVPTSMPSLGFRSLADLGRVDRSMIAQLQTDVPTFTAMVKREALKVYSRSPQSKGQIVQLWRTSPLYKLYMEIGAESMRTQKPVQEIDALRSKEKRPTLSKEEFDAIADLSRTLQQ